MIRVYTFYGDGLTTLYGERKPVKSRVSTYTKWASSEWKGCIVYEIHEDEVKTGAEARKVAVERRLTHEIAEWEKRQKGVGRP